MMKGTAGIILVDKPVGPSSRDVLDRLQGHLGIGALGHAGTLDPRASGLLIVLSGVARRLQEMFMASTKEYVGELTLGARSDTLDGEGPITPSGVPIPELGGGALDAVLDGFIGEIDQVPPRHSAVHVDGKRAYKLARKGKVVDLPPRRVVIESIEVVSVDGPKVRLRVVCGKGTYIRSLADDIGDALGCGAYLSELRRTASGNIRVAQAVLADDVTVEHVRSLAVVLEPFDRIDVDADQAVRLSHGQVLDSIEPPEELSFAWLDGRPLCRLKASSLGGTRSDLLFFRP